MNFEPLVQQSQSKTTNFCIPSSAPSGQKTRVTQHHKPDKAHLSEVENNLRHAFFIYLYQELILYHWLSWNILYLRLKLMVTCDYKKGHIKS